MLHTKFQTTELTGSEEEDLFLNISLRFKPRTPWRWIILDPGTFI